MRDINELICQEARYIVENNATVRQAGKYFGRSKSAVHQDMRDKLPRINHALAVDVSKVLGTNLAERHNRGGQSTKAKWEKMRRN